MNDALELANDIRKIVITNGSSLPASESYSLVLDQQLLTIANKLIEQHKQIEEKNE